MDDARAEAVREWDSRSAGDGYAGLRELSGEEFSGAIEAGRTTALMTNGRIVWVDGGSLDALDGMGLTAYEAPDDALPLLFAMQERGGETRAKYYTEDTSLSEVNRTLEDGGFTGYVELSENVLSGDYYVVYHGGRSSSIAFVGNSRRLFTGDEAFERADDEVGIYAVVDAEVDVFDIPGGGAASAGTDAGTGTGADTRTAETDAAGAPSAATPEAGGDDTVDPDASAGGAGVNAASADEPGGTGPAADDSDPAPDRDLDPAGVAKEAVDDGGASAGGDWGAADATRDGSSTNRAYGDEEIRVGAGLGPPDEDDEPTDGTDDDAGPTETDLAAGPAEETGGEPEADPEPTGPDAAAAGPEDGGGEAVRDAEPAPSGGAGAAADEAGGGAARDVAAERVADLEAVRDRLAAELEEARSELERVRAERDEHRAEAERLREQVATLESRVEELEADREAATAAEAEAAARTSDVDGPSLSPEEAISGTNLFVRYRSKSEPTLEAAARGDADPAAVNDNLRLELHTTFESAGATVEDEPFPAFLEGTLEYRFAQWAVRDLLYELRATGNRQEMGDLYEAIPEIDRVELGGEVRIGGSASGDDAADTREFDVILRSRMGEPLAVAVLHQDRTPASGELVETLIGDAEAIVRDAEALGAAFVVTTSYYEPPALEAADAATGGGFLSRGTQKSYVKLDRSRGFHLCLVEARDGEFNMNVPEL